MEISADTSCRARRNLLRDFSVVTGVRGGLVGGAGQGFSGEDDLDEVLGSSDSLALTSEPADIKRWFSSYVYESPELDTSDDLRGFVITESECERVPCHAENCSKEQGGSLTEFIRSPIRDELAVDKKTASNGLVKCYSSDRDNNGNYPDNTEDIQGVERNKMLCSLNDLRVKMISGQVLEEIQTRNSNYDRKTVEKASLDGKVSIGKRGGSRESDSMPLNTSSSSDRNKKKISGKVDSDRENNGKIFPENGFVSTGNNRSARPNGDRSVKRSMEASVPERRPLLERTNVQVQLTGSSEVTGKWQCPRKRKPKLGPPLKQLRLERWVRRI
ncbi:methylglutaconyl-CoA hydratase [Sarracenia purpurea var. burkii]